MFTCKFPSPVVLQLSYASSWRRMKNMSTRYRNCIGQVMSPLLKLSSRRSTCTPKLAMGGYVLYHAVHQSFSIVTSKHHGTYNLIFIPFILLLLKPHPRHMVHLVMMTYIMYIHSIMYRQAVRWYYVYSNFNGWSSIIAIICLLITPRMM